MRECQDTRQDRGLLQQGIPLQLREREKKRMITLGAVERLSACDYSGVSCLVRPLVTAPPATSLPRHIPTEAMSSRSCLTNNSAFFVGRCQVQSVECNPPGLSKKWGGYPGKVTHQWVQGESLFLLSSIVVDTFAGTLGLMNS